MLNPVFHTLQLQNSQIAAQPVNVTTEQRDGSNRCRFTFMHLVDAFIQNNLQCIQGIDSLSVCVTWELNPQPFAPLTQCSTTEPQEHKKILFYQHTRH